MTAKVKSVLTLVSESMEAAAGYALVAVGIYAVVFVDLTGGGSLWKTMHHLQEVSQDGLESPNATRVIQVPTRVAGEAPNENRMLAVLDNEPPAGVYTAVYAAPDATGLRPSAAFTDTPADPKSGKTWKRGLKGELRSFTVYGKGDQTTSAAMSNGGGRTPAPAAIVSAPVVAATEDSPARAETAAGARPGMGAHMSRGALAASDTTRNLR